MSRPGRTFSLIALAVVVVAACISDGGSSPSATQPVEAIGLPRFVEATGSLADLVGGSFDALSLPAELGGGEPDALAGAVLINAEVDPAVEDLLALHWLVTGDRANLVLSETTDDQTWHPTHAWVLEMGPDRVLTVGTTVCAAPIHTFDWQHGEFLAVVNREQDQALGAWTITRTGPTPYADLDTLICERFVP